MRKIYAFVLMMMCSLAGYSAITYKMTPENTVLTDSLQMRLFTNIDFFNQLLNGEPFDGGFAADDSQTTTEIKFNGYTPYHVTTPGLSNLWLAVGNISCDAGYGLHNTGSGPRGFLISELKKGQILVIQGTNAGYNTAGTNAEYNGFCVPNGSRYGGNTNWTWEYFDNPWQVEDISEEIHQMQRVIEDIQEDWTVDEQGEDVQVFDTIWSEADHFLYLRVLNDGWLSLPLERAASIQGVQIWIDAAAEEAVSAPSSKIVEVDGASRKVEMTSGASTLGAECQVWYGLESEEALFLIDTEEVAKADTTFVKDEEGNILYDEDGVTPLIDHIDYTYKKILDPDEWMDGAGIAGSNNYYGSPIEISDQDDEDGDGYVTIHAATVSSKGNFSDIVDIKVAVNELTLNAPTLTLVGLEGLARKYTLGWTNNTLCGEEFEVYVTVDGIEQQYDLGAEIEAEETIAARAHVEGYTDGVLEEQDVLARDMEYKRKNVEAEPDEHDWDFVHLTETQYQMIRGEYSDTYVYTTPNEQDPEVTDSIFYTRDEYLAKLESGELQPGDAVPYNPIDCGWWYDASKSRATLNVVAPDSIFNETGEFVELKINGNTPNENGYGYVDDNYVQLFNNGLSVNCPPNKSNNSCIFIYTNNDLGAYFMARPTLTFDREATQYGDYVLIYQGAGGSNYTNSRWPSLYEVPADELLSVTLQSGGVHVFYIDVYSPAESPEDPYDSIEEVQVPASLKNVIFDLSGRRVQKAEKGIFIINGKKVIK